MDAITQTSPTPERPPQNYWERHAGAIWGGLIALALLTAGLLTYLLFFRTPPESPTYEGDAAVTVTASKELRSGSEISYLVSVKNHSNTKLTDLALEIFYPSGFKFSGSTPAPDSGAPSGLDTGETPRKFMLTDMLPGAERSILVVGRLEGRIQEIKILNVKLYYTPENFRSVFVAEGSTTTEMLAPDLTLGLKAPTQVVSGENVIYEISVANVALREFADLKLKVSYPDKFSYSSAEPLPENEQSNTWKIAKISPGASQTVKISGKLSEEAGRESLFSAELFLPGENPGENLSAGRAFAFTRIAPSPLSLKHQIASSSPAAIMPGQILQYQVEYENVSDTALNNVAIAVVFETDVLDLSKLSSERGQVRDGKAVFIPAAARELLVVNPRQKGSFSFAVPVSDKLVSDRRKNPLIKTRAEFSSKEHTEPIAGNTTELMVSTQVLLAAEATAVAGPNPPVLGSPTTYRVTLKVSNTVNDLNDAELTAVIPRADAVFLAETINPSEERGKAEFVPAAGSLRWRLGQVFAFTGSFHNERTISFDLVITPASTPAGPQGLVLLKDLELSAIDSFTGRKVNSNRIENVSALK